MSHCISFNFYATPPHECSYLPNQRAITVFIDPYLPKSVSLYESLLQEGFRRSGENLYRPECRTCHACIAVRLPVQLFVPRRSQRRVWQKNQDLTVSAIDPVFKWEHFKLYCCYMKARHEGGRMDNPTPESYMQFLSSTWSKTVFYEFHIKEQLIAISIVDQLKNGLSAVYTFFDPDCSARSLGVYAILWEIEEAKRLNVDNLYLGYWVKNCQKMRYKAEYQPLEYYYQGEWRCFDVDCQLE